MKKKEKKMNIRRNRISKERTKLREVGIWLCSPFFSYSFNYSGLYVMVPMWSSLVVITFHLCCRCL